MPVKPLIPNRPAKLMAIAEAPGENEAIEGYPLVGASGAEFANMCYEADLTSSPPPPFPSPHEMVEYWSGQGLYLTNVFDERPSNNQIDEFFVLKGEAEEAARELGWLSYNLPPRATGKYLHPEYAHHLERLKEEILTANPHVILALGAVSMWAVCGTQGIKAHRGAVRYATMTEHKVIGTYHPAAILRNWKDRPIAIKDMMKAKRESRTRKIKLISRNINIAETVDDIWWFIQEMMDNSSGPISVDVETFRNQITMVAITRADNEALVIPFCFLEKASIKGLVNLARGVERPGSEGGSWWATLEEEYHAWEAVRYVLALPDAKLFQNGIYDMQRFWKPYAIPTFNAQEDTMLLHHALYPEVAKGLDFLGSVYTDERAWKLLRPKYGAAETKREE